jgi:GMP synthase (glutamine-hydrolysing)
MKQVLVLQHAAIEKPGIIADVLTSAGYSIQPVHPFDGQPVPQAVDDAQGIVIMGGPMGVYERDLYPYLQDELHLIEKALEARKPILGICLGSQLLAAALGAQVTRGRQKEIGWYPVRASGHAKVDPLLTGIEDPFVALHWHGDIFDLPRASVRLAYSEFTECQAFRYRENAYGFLFHMETTAEILGGMVTAFEDELRQESIDGSKIARAATEYLPKLQQTGRTVFERWAALLVSQQMAV